MMISAHTDFTKMCMIIHRKVLIGRQAGSQACRHACRAGGVLKWESYEIHRLVCSCLVWIPGEVCLDVHTLVKRWVLHSLRCCIPVCQCFLGKGSQQYSRGEMLVGTQCGLSENMEVSMDLLYVQHSKRKSIWGYVHCIS